MAESVMRPLQFKRANILTSASHVLGTLHLVWEGLWVEILSML